jgi:hypothetical protein
MREFLLLDAVDGKIEPVDFDQLAATLTEAAARREPLVGVCGHAGFRVPDLRSVIPLFERVADAVGRPLRLEPALADARHSSDDGGSSPLRVHVEVPVPPATTLETRKERLRLDLAGDPFVSQIPFSPAHRLERTTLSQRTVLDAYRRVVSGARYRWVSARVVAAAERTVADARPTLLDFHRHLRDIVLADQLGAVSAVTLAPTVATAHPSDFHAHIMATHQRQVAVAVDIVRSPEHAREIVAFFRAARDRSPSASLPRWMFTRLAPAAFFCRGFDAVGAAVSVGAGA